jgi:hypothetical protein
MTGKNRGKELYFWLRSGCGAKVLLRESHENKNTGAGLNWLWCCAGNLETTAFLRHTVAIASAVEAAWASPVLVAEQPAAHHNS